MLHEIGIYTSQNIKDQSTILCGSDTISNLKLLVNNFFLMGFIFTLYPRYQTHYKRLFLVLGIDLPL